MLNDTVDGSTIVETAEKLSNGPGKSKRRLQRSVDLELSTGQDALPVVPMLQDSPEMMRLIQEYRSSPKKNDSQSRSYITVGTAM